LTLPGAFAFRSIPTAGSSLDVTALDGSSATQADPIDEWAASMIALHEQHGVPVLGGCCGTTSAHLEALSQH
jgi:methionine synthase I (cobalamin-dependent)